MEYRKFGDDYLIRLDPGDEIVSSLIDFCDKEAVKLGCISGLGAVDLVEIGIFDPVKKQYYGKEFRGAYELASLNGNITRQDGHPYLHLHAVIGNVETGEFGGGHLKSARISATGEIVVNLISGGTGRRFSDEIGLNLLDFPDGEQGC